MVIVPPHGGVADIGLSSYSPVRRRPATIVSHFEDVDQEISRIQSRTAGYMNCSFTVTPVDDGFVHAVCAGHQREVHLGIVD